jgi:hypothetical protein
MTKGTAFAAALLVTGVLAFGAALWDAMRREGAEERAWLYSCGINLDPDWCRTMFRWATDGRTDTTPPREPAA